MVPTFLDTEKARQTRLKLDSACFSPGARAEGVYKGKPRPFCLPRGRAEENLYAGIRQAAMACFWAHGIKWHDGRGDRPSNHLCDSQVCGANFLFPFAARPRALAHLLRPLFPTLAEPLPVEDGLYVAFEWIGQENYLGERVPRHGKRTRGANFTSADAAVLLRHSDGRRQVVLIEWKYTESYGGADLRIARSGTDRTAIYRHLYERPDCPLRKDLLGDFGALFYEPFYQFMRQQFLAHEMERAHELGADVVSVLHIAPACNKDFQRVTSPALAGLGETATAVWGKLVRTPGRFMSVSTEGLFGALRAADLPEMGDWLEYIGMRYPWVHGKETALCPR